MTVANPGPGAHQPGPHVRGIVGGEPLMILGMTSAIVSIIMDPPPAHTCLFLRRPALFATSMNSKISHHT